MGLLDSVVGALGGQEQNSVVTQVMGLINNPNGGGLAGLLQQFKAGGLDTWPIRGSAPGKIFPYPPSSSNACSVQNKSNKWPPK